MIKKNKKMNNENDGIDENEKIKGINLENKVSKNRLEGEESENEETTGNNKEERELLEIDRDRRIELEKRERDSRPTKRVQYLKLQYVA